MKNLLILLASALLLTVGCQEGVNHQTEPKGPKFTASTEGYSVNSKTSMNADHNILWSKGDKLAIFMDSPVASLYEVTDETAGTINGSFRLAGEQNGKTDSEKNIALYPYQDNIECIYTESGYQINNVIFPESQNFTEGSFGNGSFFMAAFSQNSNLNFKNVTGAIKLQLTGNSIVKSIKLEGNNGEKLSGNATVTVHTDDSAPTISLDESASTSVVLDCGDGVQLKEDAATPFIISLPPVKFTEGFTITITTTDDKTKTLQTSKSNEVIRSSILTMPMRDLRSNVHLRFTESNKIFANPERGFYAARSTTYPLTASDIAAKRVENITLFYIGYYIPVDALIPESSSNKNKTSISRIKNEMKLLRDNGAKCILRFAYSDSEEETPWDATPEWVAKHIEQVKPILQEYSDVILTFQAGYVGVWGEWYYTDNFGFNPQTTADHKLRKQVTDAMLAALPTDRSIALRTPMFKRMMYADSYKDTLTVQTAYNESAKARISCFNDCFGASSSDYGTFSGSETREYWKKDTRYVLMGGETCGVSEYCTCKASLKDMEDYHWTYLNSDYNKDVINGWQSNSCLDEIKRRLGYRLSLTDVYHSTNATSDGYFNVKISIKNTGFAAPMNSRGVELILIDKAGRKTVYDLSKEVDPRYWFAKGTYTIDSTIKLPADAIGTCTMYLNLPDPKTTLHDNPKFSIRLANDDVWNESTGYNKLFEFEVYESGTAPAPEPETEPEPDQDEEPGTSSGENISWGQEFNPWK